jgi:homoserine O-acetyltransferase/O-succinyltransferase
MYRTMLLFAALLVWAMPQAYPHGADQAKHQIANLGEMTLESGAVLRDLRMSYVTHGKLNPAKDNAILLLHGFGANHHSFDGLIGPGKALDTDRYFIISSDQFGNTQIGFEHSSSPTASGLKMKFPQYNYRDMIQAQHKLVTEALGIRRLLSVAGISMGASHAVQYAVSHPDFMDSIIPIVGIPVYGTERYLWNTQIQLIIESCAGWQGGNYSTNSTECSGAALWTLVNYFFSPEWWDANIPTQEAFDQFRKAWWGFYLGLQDMRDLHYLSKALGASSLAATPGFNGDLAAALRAIKAKTMFVYSPKDMFFLPKHLEEQARLIPNARVTAIDSNAGHLICCGVDPQAYWIVGETMSGFLREIRAPKTAAR